MKNNVKLLLACTVLMVLMAALVSAYVIWQQTSIFTVQEPFTVSTDLPTTITVYPDNYSYTLNVTNHGGILYNATLLYTVTAVNVSSCIISPVNGTSYSVAPGTTVTIPISVAITLESEKPNGTVTINWSIDRVLP